MDVAVRTSELSYATRLKVGAVAVRDKRIVCVGFNGTPPGLPNVCESDGVTLPTVLHAEENLILFAAKNGISLNGCSIYITHQPCLNCARMIYGAGISDVTYKEIYRTSEGLEFLESVGVTVRRYDARDLP
jgi:dCMP deaminase